MAVKQLWSSPPQFVDANGDPYSGAFLFFYAAGSSTKQDTFTDDTGNTACPNPITLNSSGYPAVSGTVLAPFGTAGQTYKIGLAAPGSSDPPASFIWSVDDIAPTNDTSVTIDEWVAGATPTYIGATSFSLIGDQTSTYHVGRRLKTTNSGGTVYSTITASAYGVLTTITVVNDSGSLDAGLSAVYYGILSATNPSTPLLADTYPIVSGSSDKTKKLRIEVDGLTTATTRVLTMSDENFTTPTTGTQASTFTFNGSGGTSGSTTMTYQKVGNFVTLNIPATTATSGTGSTAFASNTALPAAIRPAAAQNCPFPLILNNGGGTTDVGNLSVSTGGIITINRDPTGTAYTNSSSCGTSSNTSITYFIG